MKTFGLERIFSLVVFLQIMMFVDGIPAFCEELMLDSFEGEIGKKTVDFGGGSGSTLQVTASKDNKSCGQQAIQLSYKLEPSSYLFCARGDGLDVASAHWEGPAHDKIDWAKYTGISLMMSGKDNGPIAFDVKDAGGELWRFMLENKKDGWVEMVVPFNKFTVRDDWQPTSTDGNRKLDFPIKSFQFEPKQPGEGVVYFDCVKLVAEVK